MRSLPVQAISVQEAAFVAASAACLGSLCLTGCGTWLPEQELWQRYEQSGIEATDQGRLPEAQTCFREALQTAQRANARPRMALSLKALAGNLQAQGQAKQALVPLQQAVNIYDSLSRGQSGDAGAVYRLRALQLLGQSAGILSSLQEYDRSEELYRTALRGLRREQIPDSLPVATALYLQIAPGYMDLLRQSGRRSEADTIERSVRLARQKPVSELVRDVSASQGSIVDRLKVAEDMLAQGKKQAHKEIVEAIARSVGASRNDDPDFLAALGRLANNLGVLGQHEQAVRVRQRLLAVQLRTLGSQSPEYAHTMLEQAGSLYGMDRYDDALALLAKATPQADATVISNVGAFALMQNCAGKLTAAHKYARAQYAHQLAIKLARELGDGEQEALARERLAQLYELMGDPRSAARTRKQARPAGSSGSKGI